VKRKSDAFITGPDVLDSLSEARNGEVVIGGSTASNRDCLRLCRTTIKTQSRTAMTMPPMTPPAMAGVFSLRLDDTEGLDVAAAGVDAASGDVVVVVGVATANSGLLKAMREHRLAERQPRT
jgi:hypothetical protein